MHDDIHILEQDLEDHSNNNLCEIDRDSNPMSVYYPCQESDINS